LRKVLDEKILGVDSDLNESTILWWIKIDLPWIEPIISDLGAPWITPVRVHTEKDTFRL